MEDAGQVQGDGQHQQGQTRRHRRRLQLEAPAHGLAGRPQGQKNTRQQQEGRQHAGQEGQSVAPGVAFIMGRARQRGGLHGQDRKDAGHQIEDESAEDREQQGLGEGHQIAAAVRVSRPGIRVGSRSEHAGSGCACGQRTRLGPDFPGSGGRHQHTPDRPGQARRPGLAARPKSQDQTLRSPCAGLGGRMVDDPSLKGEEIAGPRIASGQGPAGRAQGQYAVLQRDPRRDPRRSRRVLQHRSDRGTVARVQRRGTVADPQVQPQGQFVRNAHLGAADEEQGLDDQGQGCPGSRRGRDLDRDRQIDRARIAVVHQPRDSLPFGHRPDDVAGADTLGQGPGQGRGSAGIPRVAPIGVPVRPDGLFDRHHGRRSGGGPGRHWNQLCLDTVSALRPRGRSLAHGLRGPKAQGQQDQHSNERVHTASGNGRRHLSRPDRHPSPPPSATPRRAPCSPGPIPRRGAASTHEKGGSSPDEPP